MSTGAGCYFTEVEPGRWTYGVQQWPYGETQEYDKHGPFRSFRAAREHLDGNYANPGGYALQCHPTGHVHEWTGHGARRPTGVEFSVVVKSLGPNPDRASVLALVASLSPDNPAIRITPVEEFDPSIVICEACYARRDEVKR